MKKITTFLFAILLFAACKDDETPKTAEELALEEVEAAVWGKFLTQEFIPDVPFTATIDDEISFLDMNGDTHAFEVEEKEGLLAPENPSYPGTSAVFSGGDYQMFVTLLGSDRYRLKAEKSGISLMEGTFTE